LFISLFAVLLLLLQVLVLVDWEVIARFEALRYLFD